MRFSDRAMGLEVLKNIANCNSFHGHCRAKGKEKLLLYGLRERDLFHRQIMTINITEYE